ncbi:MAG: apolipoprotein N-acyltransferase [Myxococcota bacterium]|nr:apolipoprotein N-acyltransferase [Myxococcota bacterium]
MSTRSRAAIGVAYVVATFLAFPHVVGSGEIDLGLVFAWLSPALLLLAVWGLPPLAAARVGFLASWAAHTAILHWIYVVTVRYGAAPVVVGVIAPPLLALYMALPMALFCAGFVWWRERRPGTLFAAAALWVLVEYSRHWLLTGFPWALIGYAQHRNPALLGLASLTGVLGLSFATVLGGAVLAAAARRDRSLFREAVAASLLLGGLLVVGGLRFAATDPDEGPRISVAVLQGNVPQDQKWSPGRLYETLASYADLTRRAVAEGAQVVVFPETAVAAPAEAMPPVLSELKALARETGAALVVGTVGLERGDPLDPQPPKLFDSALILGPSGERVDRYDKTHLVPFGEYLPLRALLGRFIRAIATGSAGQDVTPGERVRRVDLPLPQGPEGPPEGGSGVLPAGVPICYELIFPDRVRRFVGDGGGVLLGITNDAWYGRTGAPLQFLAMTAMRSAENGVWTARAANTGVSAFIDRRGRVRERTGLLERGYLVSEVPVLPQEAPRTFYTENGDWIVAVCGLWIGGLWLAGGLLRRSRA